MVFSCVMIVKGYPMTIDDVFTFVKYLAGIYKQNCYKFLQDEIPSEEENKKEWLQEWISEINNLVSIFRRFQIYTPQCCSEQSYKIFVLGRCVKKYERINVQCDNCTENSCCDTCLGQTENGFYNVNEMYESNTIIKVEPDNICNWCYNDNREKIEGCKFCDRSQLAAKGISLRDRVEVDIRLVEWIQSNHHVSNYYYMLDDCLSCT